MRNHILAVSLIAVAMATLPLSGPLAAQESPGAVDGLVREGRSILFTASSGQRLRLTPYGNFVVRVQTVRTTEEFFPDNHYEMVQSHRWPGGFSVTEDGSSYRLTTPADDGIVVQVNRNPLRIAFAQNGRVILGEKRGVVWSGDSITAPFICDTAEHFIGLGHDFYGRSSRLDLQGQRIHRNYGSMHRQQAPLIVPFFLSSKGYGFFLNSTFPNAFSFGHDGRYEVSITGKGRMDYFVIAGPSFREILDRYTQLTGRPRFPPKAAFGLALSDKGNDHTSPDSSDETWWKRAVTEHRQAGFPIDHLVNDNRWRAGGGRRCESFFQWDTTRFPDPTEYAAWIQSHGLFATIDFNRCIASHSEGWQPRFNIPSAGSIDFADSAPDLTSREMRGWFWNLFWSKSLNPDLHYPGDALWIDEFDEMGAAPGSMILANGRTWDEMRNSWFLLVAKALVEEGWDTAFHGSKRPFVWVRGMTAGGQRFATLWSGDIRPTYEEMQLQVRGMLAAGISGFPYWGHDAGGFFDYDKSAGPDDTMYRQWSMALGSFTPFWKPHGPGESRWPLKRSREAQKEAHTYSRLRYELLPYLYTYAHEASATGNPIARAMVIDYQASAEAWKHDLQYLWGDELLIAPNCSEDTTVPVWLPPGKWYNFWTDSLCTGNEVIPAHAPIGEMPIYVRAGSIIPMAPFALSTSWIPDDSLSIHIYPGSDGMFTLYEDDGRTEAYVRGESRTTRMTFTQSTQTLTISPAEGTYAEAPSERAYTIVVHGLPPGRDIAVKEKPVTISVSKKSVTQSLVVPLFPAKEGK